MLIPLKPDGFRPREIDTIVAIALGFYAELVLVSVADDSDVLLSGRTAGLLMNVIREQIVPAEASLRTVAEQVRSKGILVTTVLEKGRVIESILRAADEQRCDVIVLPGHPSGLFSGMTGRIVDAIVRAAKVP